MCLQTMIDALPPAGGPGFLQELQRAACGADARSRHMHFALSTQSRLEVSLGHLRSDRGSKRMRVFLAAVMALSLSGAAYAQTQSIPKYGDEDKPKSASQIEADKAAERAYQHSLGAIPDKGPSDPWGTVRSNDAPKTSAVKTKTKTGSAAAKTGNPN
jgi:hypothetical protein